MTIIMHKPVLLDQVLAAFQGKSLRIFIDGTLGFGGHSEALLKAHPEIERFLGIDQDAFALETATKRLNFYSGKFQPIHGSFRHMAQYLEGKADGILLDVGVSSRQLDDPARGFSFSKEGPLDMRMDPEQALTAKTIINRYPEHEIARILHEYGEVRGSRRLAKALVEERKKRKFQTTTELTQFLTPLIGYRPKHLHPMTLVFQALRIAVNDELGALEEGISQAFGLLSPGGRLAVISFHSLEDRIVKNFFREKARVAKEGLLLTKKPLVAEPEEVKENPRARSAKLRVIEKI